MKLVGLDKCSQNLVLYVASQKVVPFCGVLVGATRLDLAFENKALRYVCESLVKAQNKIGKEPAAELHARLADMEAADSLCDLTWVKIEFGPTSATVQFHKGYRLIIAPNGAKAPVRDEGVDWTKVDRLLLKKLEQA